MSIHLSRKIVSDTLTVGVPKSYPLPRNNMIRAISCRLAGSITVSGGSTSGTVKDSSTLALLNSVEVRRNGQDTLIKAEPALLHRLTQIFYGTRGEMVEISSGGTQTNTAVSGSFIIPFEVMRGYKGIDTGLQAGGLATLDLNIDVGQASQLIQGGDRTTAVGSTAFTFVAETIEERGLDSLNTGDMKIYSAAEAVVSASSANFQIKPLPVGNEMYAIVVFARVDNILSNAVVNNIRLSSGSEVFVDRAGAALQAENKMFFGMETWPTGIYVMPLSRDGMLNSTLDLRQGTGRNSLELTVDATQSGTTTKLSAYCIEYIRPKPQSK